ncbi:MAG: NADH-quinone oxidoreductase subunit NuoK [Dehalococcoidia bacterium]|nr:NADH-quinone oxidoreductase subunit NuoK [Dehalococcoidia bacterium]MXZ89064.1 NADH-quinone oxidoreductase subunit NuoK [Dehalococcoidia bacterium]MYA54028.1 NADH-quinone oxidoreductase subunit NuoK [Dehalococcoidia bacterium]MYH67971.1 NADH-quinone oxidoreductase subunit NuoK [Dehalococcoidia bacterium]
MLTLEHFLTVGALLFCLGLVIALSKRNAIGVLMGIELMLNSVNITLVAFSRFSDGFAGAAQPIAGHAFVAFIITVAAAEAAVALALAVAVYRSRQTVEVDQLDLLKL